ncbi:Hypothetical protein GLP15_4715 [Giardia lamblia P15]|uniref:Uncharacterized protein n=1 Tax=Giardia intestinalis (strain P15) TaxID=658858 RepID=E1F1P3_GIAIA|nr:Hypothetical protein GLP15_4715 [Giardia lamblia P15]
MVQSFFTVPLTSEGPASVTFSIESEESSKPVGVTIYSDRTVEVLYNADGKLETRRIKSCCILNQGPTSLTILGIEQGALVQWCLDCVSFHIFRDYNMIGDFLPRRSRQEVNTIDDLLIRTEDGVEGESNLMEFFTTTYVTINRDAEPVRLAAQRYAENLSRVQNTLSTEIHKLLIEEMETDVAMKDQRQQRRNEWLMLRGKIEQAINPDDQDDTALASIKLVVPNIQMPEEYSLLNSIQETQDEALDEFISIINDEEVDKTPAQ